MLCLMAGGLAGIASAQTSLYIENPGFELPGTNKISSGWDASGTNDVPGWMDAGSGNSNSGIEGTDPNGGWVWGANGSSVAAYCSGGQPGAYQITTNVMAYGKKYTLTWYAAADYYWSGGSQRVSIIRAAATNTPFASCTENAVFTGAIDGANLWHGPFSQYSLTCISGNADAGKYIGMHFTGSDWTGFDEFALTVEDATLAEMQPQITAQPAASQVLYEGGNFTLTAAASGPDLVYQWKAGAQYSGVYTNIPGATNATLSVSWAVAGNTADYVLHVSNPSGAVTSDVASVTVYEATYVNGVYNGDFELPGTGKINSGFDVVNNDVPGWRNAGPNQNDTGIESSGSGHNSSFAAYLHRGQSGAYQITPTAMQLNYIITLSWWARDSWQGVTQRVSLLSATSPQDAFGSTTTLASVTNNLAGTGWTQYSINYTVGAADVGKLIGIAFQTAEPATAAGWANLDDFSIAVTPPGVAPTITVQPAGQTNWLASTTVFTVSASGSGLSYQWKAGVVGSGIYTNLSNAGQFSGVNTATLTITNLSLDNVLDYVVTISNTGGSITSDPASLGVITDTPWLWNVNSQTVAQYDTATFAAGNAGATSYQWQAGAVGSGTYTNLSNGGRFSGVNTATLTITSVQMEDALDYLLLASNVSGTSTSTVATLTVTPVIYLENFQTANAALSGIGWVADAVDGVYNHIVDGVRLRTVNSATGPQAFYTTTQLDTGSTGPAFPVIKLADVTGLTFSVQNQSWWGADQMHTYIAVQMNWGQWYVSATEIPQATGNWTTQTMTFDPGAYAWNELTVSGTGSTNTASVPVIGNAAAGNLAGYVTGAGLVVTSTGSAWLDMDNFKITGDGFTVLPGLSITTSGANPVLKWGYGTLVESTSVTGPWTPVSGTSPKTLSPTDGSHFYRLQLP
ncbi:MAG TPA: hypothetical protein VK327_15135 [Candidatus Paceibacterota bacterium]|nr:hypothetical protein [Candidatus Paceibacterota bacterium]